jgi:hypothetical protein
MFFGKEKLAESHRHQTTIWCDGFCVVCVQILLSVHKGGVRLNRRQFLQNGIAACAGYIAATRLGFIVQALKSSPTDGREIRYFRDDSLKKPRAPMRLPHYEEFYSIAITLDVGQRASNWWGIMGATGAV